MFEMCSSENPNIFFELITKYFHFWLILKLKKKRKNVLSKTGFLKH